MNTDERQLGGDESAQNAVATYEVSEGESTTEAVVSAISSVSGTDETELEPLYGTVDPDALDSLFRPRRDGAAGEREGYVTFEYGRYDVRIESDGTVVIY